LSIHKDAPLAHLASVAAFEQGKFWEFHDKVFTNQPKIQREFLLQYARDVGLDMKRFTQVLELGSGKGAIDADMAEGNSMGSFGTPAFFVNGHYMSGAKPFEEFAKVINAELTRLNIPIPAEAVKSGG